MLIIPRKSLLSLFLINFVFVGASVCQAQSEPWVQKFDELQKQREIIFERLENIYIILERRIKKEEPGLMPQLSLEPPKPRATGYGLFPEIRDNSPYKAVNPEETLYSLKWVESRLDEELQKVNALDDLARNSVKIEPVLVRFEQSLKTLRNLESNLSYHGKWQNAVMQYPAYYRKKNQLVALAREIYSQTENNGSMVRIDELRQQLSEKLAPFKATKGLQIIEDEGGRKILPVTICTDIEDADFLQAFQDGVQESFSKSPAARANGFSIDLKWLFIGVETLYPDGAPNCGAKIDMEAHHALFQGCPLVVTSGASSLNARVGSRIFLGTRPVSRRTLAHEFGHLLGFKDAYVRGYDGDPGDPYGVVLVEWTGLSSDLMGDSGRGQVSDEMINTLIIAYGGQKSVP